MPNRLATEKSPYLQQHADNPVEWYPWGREALDRARREMRPILVSIGYSACHWCHVMAHESFEDEQTARLMNAGFVNIKVDREERPDVDAIYMEAVQALTGHGGWPLNVFLTPDGRPFFGGTYFPPQPRHGLPSWMQVLESVAAAVRERPADIEQNAETLTAYVTQMQQMGIGEKEAGADEVMDSYRAIALGFDREEGGYGGAPKFPQPLLLDFLLQVASRLGDGPVLELVEFSLQRMAARGIHDQLGGGFHRYTVDELWIVPHFEKMLYDNALLARVYLHAYQLTGRVGYRDVVEDTLEYLLRDLNSPDGAFYSSQDADSEGVEGKYYVWSPEEVCAALTSQQAEAALFHFGITPTGNFEGKTIPTVASGVDSVARSMGIEAADAGRLLDEARRELLLVRSQRIPPGTDAKIVTAWNALAVRALAEAGSALGRSEFVEAAERCADFLLRALRPDGRLVRSYREGPADVPGFLEDHAYLVEALLTLYESTGRNEYFTTAEEIMGEALRLFWDEEAHVFFDAPHSGELIVRPRSPFDNPIPAGSSSAVMALVRLHALSGKERYADIAGAALRTNSELLRRASASLAYFLSSLDFWQQGAAQIAVVSGVADSAAELVRTVHEHFLPYRAFAWGSGETPALLAGRVPIEGRAAAYVCRSFICELPATDVDTLKRQLALPTRGARDSAGSSPA